MATKLVSSFPPMIKIPVHEEAGWSTPSTPEASDDVRARLEASSSRTPRSPEELRRAEDQARLLHEAHVASVAERAARESQRALEAKQRRLRMEETAKAKLEQRKNEHARRSDRLTAERAKVLLQRQERREAYANAVREARAAREEALEARATAELERLKDATHKRGKNIQATVDKNAHAVKHALAVAAAVKEQHREAAERVGAKLSTRLEAAKERRIEEATASLTRLHEREKECARQVASTLSAHAVEIAQKKRLLELSMERATMKREQQLADVCRRAALETYKVAEVADAKVAAVESESKALKEKRKEHFSKMNDAAIRRANQTLAIKVPAVIEIDFRTQPPPPPPRALVERISVKRASALTPEDRHARASANREKLCKHRAAKCARSALRVMAARSYLDTAKVIREAELDSRMRAAADQHQFFVGARREIAAIFNRRVDEAKVRRSAVEGAYKRHMVRVALRKQLATGRRAVLVLSQLPLSQRMLAASARRTKAVMLQLHRSAEMNEKCTAATVRREALLRARVSRAHLSAVSRSTAIKLTKDGGLAMPVNQKDVKQCEKTQGQPLPFFI